MNDEMMGCCDLVMKGGVTSGVVYPGAIQEIARRFHFVGIGGTSAGAIAATVAAAAEYRRRHTQSLAGFEMLDQVSSEIAEAGRLESLFRPDLQTRHLFSLASSATQGKLSRWELVKLAIKLRNKKRINRFLEPLIANDFGVCSGMAHGNAGDKPPITQWLCDLIDRVAGMPPGKHLTFRDLHDAPSPAGFEAVFESDSDDRVGPDGGRRRYSIDFRAVTTSLTFNRPIEFPLQTQFLAFDINEWRGLFPESVMEQLLTAARNEPDESLTKDEKLPLPIHDLPIIVAARMSLSFPLLFSAVPLWAINHHEDEKPLRRVLFSDGGITSNFPVHRFDAIYPRWPTLALNFKGTDDNNAPQRRELKRSDGSYEYVFMNPDREQSELDIWTTILKSRDPIGSVQGFLFSIFRSAQNWHDNAFLRLPGFQDRVAEIWLKPGQGGLNLHMEKPVIDELIALGRQAGKSLVARYADLDATDQMSWSGHQWTRFRSGMQGLTDAIELFGKSLGETALTEMDLKRYLSELNAPPCYRFKTEEQRENAKNVTESMHALALELKRMKAFSCGPLPPTEHGSRAPIQR